MRAELASQTVVALQEVLVGKTVKDRVESDVLRVVMKPRLGRLIQEYGKFVRLAATGRDAQERAQFARKAEIALKQLDAMKREAGRMVKG